MMLQKALNIAGEVLDTHLDVNVTDFGNDWHQVALLHLVRSRQTLAGIRFLAAKQFYSPTEVLCRHLFELAVNIRYLNIDPVSRVRVYLEHYRVRASSEERYETDAKLQSLREQEDHVEISKLLIPGRSWVTLKNMCDELGWLGEYETIYRGSSEMAHGGARAIGLEILALVSEQPMLQYVVSFALLKALIYYFWVEEVCCEAFPRMALDLKRDPLRFEQCSELQEELSEAINAYR